MNRPCAAWQRRKAVYGAAAIQPFNEYPDVGGFAAASRRVFIISQSPRKMGLCKSSDYIWVGKAHFRKGRHGCVSASIKLWGVPYYTMNRPCAAWQRRKAVYGAAAIQPFNEYPDVGGFAAASRRVFIISQSPRKMGLCKSSDYIWVGKAHFQRDATATFLFTQSYGAPPIIQ